MDIQKVPVKVNECVLKFYDNTYRDLEDNHRLRDRLSAANRLNHENAHCRERQQQAHLDIETGRVQEAAEMPLIPLVAVNRSPQAKHSEAIIEAAQHEDAVQPLAQDEQGEDIRRDLF